MNRRKFIKLASAMTLTGVPFLWHALSDTILPDAFSGATLLTPSDEIQDNFGNFNVKELLSYQKTLIEHDRDKPVFIEQSVDPFSAGYSIMQQLSPVLNDQLSVLIKPNVGGFAWFKGGMDNGLLGRITDIRFVDGIVSYLNDEGVGQILIAEGWGIPDPKDFQKLWNMAGYRALAKKHKNTRLVDLNHYNGLGPNDDECIPVQIDMPDAEELKTGLVVSRVYLEHIVNGLVINVPKLKTHRFPFVSAGMKNLMGAVGFDGPGLYHQKKWKMHAELTGYLKRRDTLAKKEQHAGYIDVLNKFSNRLCDAYDILHPHITIIDGVLAAEGDGFNKLSSVPLCTAIGSYNTISADIVASNLAGYWQNNQLMTQSGFHSPPYLVAAAKKYDRHQKALEHITIIGDQKAYQNDLRLDLIGLADVNIKGNAKETLRGGNKVSATYVDAAHVDIHKEMMRWPVEATSWIMSDWKGRSLPPGVATGFRCLYTQEELIVFFVAHYRSIDKTRYSDGQKDVPDLFKHDVVELFLDPGPKSPNTYFEWELNPARDQLDLAVDLDHKKYDVNWDSNWTGFSFVHEERRLWYSAIRLPFSKTGRPEKGETWKANFFRVEGKGKDRLYMAWQPTETKRPAFHKPDKFGQLVFG